MIKSLAELKTIKDNEKGKIDNSGTRVVVGLATCGIAAGARPIFDAFADEIGKRKLGNVTVSQTGCIGICQYEPVVEVFTPEQGRVTYVNMSPDKVGRIVAEHLVNGNVVTEFTIGHNVE